jgi:RNA polymerase sigma-70 factor, ECF subfamily
MVSGVEATPSRVEEAAVVAAARAGDESAFAALAERYRRELQVHCYRMLGSLEDAEDLVQETFLRAWRGRTSFQGRSSFRTWLYRIATNACLNALARRSRRVLPPEVVPASPAVVAQLPAPDFEVAWLQPYPDRLLEPAAPSDAQPDAVVVARETIELAFLAAVQHLPPRQRAVLLLRDVLGWSAGETAALLEASVSAVNSALQRARSTLRRHLPARRGDWAPSSEPSQEEREVLRRYLEASERSDAAAVAELLAEDVRQSMPPYRLWYEGREAIASVLADCFDPASPGYVGELRQVVTGANLQPALANYARWPGEGEYRALSLDVLRIERGKVVEITSFVGAELFGAFGLPLTLSGGARTDELHGGPLSQ